MIEEISIRNLGVIASSSLYFHPRMTVITGETGAGKTMALTSLQLLMGAKANASLVREGAEKATVEGIFQIPADSEVCAAAEDSGGSVDLCGDEATLVVLRQVSQTGRSRARVGGAGVPAAVLKEIAGRLFTVHGQADQLRLGNKSDQLRALDGYARIRELRVYADYVRQWKHYRQLTGRYTAAKDDLGGYGARRLALEALIRRVEAVDPQIGEEEELRARAHRLEHSETYRQILCGSLTLLDGSDSAQGVLSLLDSAIRELSRGEENDFAQHARTLADAAQLISDVSTELNAALQNTDADPGQLDRIYGRRAALNEIQRDLAMDIPTMLERCRQAREELSAAQDPREYLRELETRVSETREELQKLAGEISDIRRRAAGELSRQVSGQLRELSMAGAQFTVRVREAGQLSETGGDDVSFLLSAHPGARFAQLAQTASGGEMSRIMLALEVVLAQKNSLRGHTFVFDEIDAGIGGETALQVGRRLARLARTAQVIVVTHLAQVAAFGDTQLVVSKTTDGKETFTTVQEVKGEEREAELARMLSGQTNSTAARIHAAQLLELGATEE